MFMEWVMISSEEGNEEERKGMLGGALTVFKCLRI